jgi:hypothetical protein
MKKLTSFIVLALMLMSFTVPAYANGTLALPHAFYGRVFINGNPAAIGTIVEARGEGVATGIAGNPITTIVSGIYGTSNPFEPRLIVQGDIEEGATLTFYVNDVSSGQTAEWHSGETTQLDLSVTIAAPPAGPGAPGGGPAPALTLETNLFGIEGEFEISSEGIIQETITATSADGKVTITIPEGTEALDADGNPLESLSSSVVSPPEPPEGDYVIGLAYDFGPDGATFYPSITFEFTVDPADIPPGLTIDDLVLAYYDETATPPRWVEVTTSVVSGTNTLRAYVSHFTIFAILGKAGPAAFSLSSLVISLDEVAPGEEVKISVSVANTGGKEGSYTVVLKINGITEAEKGVTVAAGDSQTVDFNVTKEEAGSYDVVVDGLSGSFTVVVPPPPPPEEEEVVVPPPPPSEEEEVVVPAPAPTPTEPEVTAPVTPKPTSEGINWPLVGGLIAAVIILGLIVFFLVGRRAY